MVPSIINQNITKENFIPIDISGGRGTLIAICHVCYIIYDPNSNIYVWNTFHRLNTFCKLLNHFLYLFQHSTPTKEYITVNNNM
jgi:hypothetical protein